MPGPPRGSPWIAGEPRSDGPLLDPLIKVVGRLGWSRQASPPGVVIPERPERNDWQLVVGFAIKLDDQAPRRGKLGGTFQLQKQLESARAGNRSQAIDLRRRIVARAEQRPGIGKRLAARDGPISQ